ncbi:hypothetical protein CRUP_011170 [Coryphaenoides rupestris]|nr:hypothetical protein CRUP_011170 [Coryphaenoides rupestris]
MEKKQKKNKVHLFLSSSGIDILEKKTKYMLFTCPLSSVSFCGVLPTAPKSHVLVSVIGDTFRVSQKEVEVRGQRDLIVEALRHKDGLNVRIGKGDK